MFYNNMCDICNSIYFWVLQYILVAPTFGPFETFFSLIFLSLHIFFHFETFNATLYLMKIQHNEHLSMLHKAFLYEQTISCEFIWSQFFS